MKSIRQLFIILSLVAICATGLAQDEPPEAASKSAEKLVEQLNSRYHDERREARTGLEAMGEAALKPLLKALESDVSGVRSNAAVILGRMKIKEALPELLKLVDDNSLEVRKKAAEAMEKVGPQALEMLRGYLEETGGKRRELIEDVLGRALLEMVKDYIEKNAVDTGKCMYCPGQIKELKELGPGIRKALEYLSDWSRFGTVSYYALNVFGDLGDKEAAEFLRKKHDEAKGAGVMVYRAGASMALAKLGEPKFAEELIKDIKMGIYTSGAGQHSSLGATYLEMDKLDEAEYEFKEAIKIAPEISYTFRLGCVFGMKGDAAKAVEHVKKAVEGEFIKASLVRRFAYFDKVRDSKEWKEFIEGALKAEKEESEKQAEEDKEKAGEAKKDK